MAQVQIKDMSHRHRAIIDWLMAHPHRQSLQPLCAELGFSRSWLSVVMRSDVFREEYTARWIEHNSALSRQIIEKQLAVTMKALDVLDDELDTGELEPRLVLDIATKVSADLGYTPRRGNAPAVESREEHEKTVEREVSTGVVERARETYRRVHTTFQGDTPNALPAPNGQSN